MWTHNQKTALLEFNNREMQDFLVKNGYKIELILIEKEDEDQFSSKTTHVVKYFIPIKGNYTEKFWREQDYKNNLHHPYDALRIVFEEEMKNKLLNL